MARRAHRPDMRSQRQVEAMSAYGIPELDIARVLAIDPKTLRKHYRDELDTGQTKATAKVAEFLFRKATTDGPQAVTAAIFWMKTRGGWRETAQEHQVDLRHRPASSYTDAELIEIIAGEFPNVPAAISAKPPTLIGPK